MKILKNKYISHKGISKSFQEVSGNLKIDLKLTENTQVCKKGKVCGKIKDENGNAIKNAFVKIMTKELSPLMYTFTDDNGEYFFENISENKLYKIIAISKGRQLSETCEFKAESFKLAKKNLILNKDKDINTGVIEGTLLSFIIKKPVLKARVELFKKNKYNTKELIGITYTNKYGEYVFLKIPKGNYILKISALGFNSIEAYAAVTLPKQIVSMKLTIQYKTYKNKNTVH